jgi:DNA-directed RNA polymerase I, II, and III subunit RPABC3
VYRFDEGTEEKVVAYASFGGLLMALSGSFRFLSNISAFGILAAERD